MKPRLLVLVAVLVLAWWLFGPMFLGARLPAFRDTADFYYPLFKFQRDEWRAGLVPLWNPSSNLGVPLAATGTASTFYPGQLLFQLPLDYDTAFRIYLVGHLLLAVATAYRLARCVGTSVDGAGIAAISYAFCGNVLFQYCNLVFLVGAAWLPAAVEAALRMARGRSLRWAVTFGLVLALIVLGGDPQAAYHAGLLAAALTLILSAVAHDASRQPETTTIARRCHPERSEGPGVTQEEILRCAQDDRSAVAAKDCTEVTAKYPARGCGRFFAALRMTAALGRTGALGRTAPVLLAVAAVSAVALSAVQILPSMEMAARSDRAASWSARSLWEIPAALMRDEPARRIADGLLCRDEEGVHHERVFHYSVVPWRLAEYVLPNVSGRQFPIHRRWLDAVGAEERVWVPTLYMGLVPLALALGAMRFWRADRVTVVLSWTAVLAVLAGLGRYGGLYWLMSVALPGYIEFRYPAKLLVFAALALAMLAGLGWDRAASRSRRVLVGLGGLGFAGAVLLLAVRPWWSGWLSGADPDPLFGPLDVGGAFWDVFRAFLQTATVGLVGWWLLGRQAAGRGWAGAAAIVLVASDVAAANGWLIATAPADAWRTPPVSPSFARAFRHETWLPDAWQETSSPDRLEELIRWNRETGAPHHHLTEGLGLVEVYGTMNLADYDLLCSAASDPAVLDGRRKLPGAVGLDPERAAGLLDALGTEALVMPSGVSRRSGAFPRAWIVHDVVRLAPLAGRDPAEMVRRSLEVLRDGERPRNLRRQAVVEAARALPTVQGQTATGPDEQESCRVLCHAADRVEIEVQLHRPGLVVLSDQFYPGWQLSVASGGRVARTAEILRTNRVMRGVWLPPGRHRLVYRYIPLSFAFGVGLSLAGLLVVGGVLCPRRRRRPLRLPG